MSYSEHVKTILESWASEAAQVGDQYLDINIPGLNELSVNAHNMNAYITLLRSNGAFQNKDLMKVIGITCARIAVALEKAEKVQAEQEKQVEQVIPEEVDAG